jgi:hypothetical protein
MATGFGPLAEVMWTEAARRCAVVMILTRKGDILTDSEIANLTGVDCSRVNQQKGALTESRDPRQSFPMHQEPLWPPGRSGGPLHIFETGIWVNTDIYLEVMESTVLPWIKTVAGDRPWVWPQDPAACHVSNRFIKWLKDHCYDLVSKDCWPPSSPDLNPLDYFVLGYLEAHTT